MNKYIVILLLGVVTVVLAESSLKRDKDTLIKALKEKFKQYKKQKQSEGKLSPNGDASPSSPTVHNQKQHDKAASAIGLALLDVSKPKTKEEKKPADETEDNDDDEMPEESEDLDEDSINVEVSSKKEDTNDAKPKTAHGNEQVAYDLKTPESKEVKQEDTEGDKKDDSENDEESEDEKTAVKENKEEDKTKDNDEKTKEHSHKKDDEKTTKDSDKDGETKSKKKLKDTAKPSKESEKSLKDKGQDAVNVGKLKKLLATSVENLDKAEKAIQNLLQYDKEKQAHSRNRPVPLHPPQGYPQQGYGGYPQPPSPYQATCPGQCSSLCAPACRDPCCRFPPNMGYNPAPPVQARGSYQQGLINAYPPMSQLGGNTGNQNYQTQSFGQQCGPQCTAQSCAPSCSPSCCSGRGQIVPPGQANAGCPMSCLSNCAAACHVRCCVPGKK